MKSIVFSGKYDVWDALATIIVLIVLLVRWLSRGSSATSAPFPTRKTALDMVKERFARGEIDKEEFEERKRLLTD